MIATQVTCGDPCFVEQADLSPHVVERFVADVVGAEFLEGPTLGNQEGHDALSRSDGATHNTSGTRTPARSTIVVFIASCAARIRGLTDIRCSSTFRTQIDRDTLEKSSSSRSSWSR